MMRSGQLADTANAAFVGEREAKAARSTRRAISPLTLRLTKEERAKLEELAAGMTLSTYVRACVFGQDTLLHSGAAATQGNGQIRQAPLQTAQSHRNHVRQAQGLAAGCNQIRPMPQSLPLGNRSRGPCHLLAMSPEPSFVR